MHQQFCFFFFLPPFASQEQYELVHKAIAQLFEKQLQLLESPTNAQIRDGTVRRSHAHAAGSAAGQRDRMSLSNTLGVREKREIMSHRGGKGRGSTRERARPSENSLQRPWQSLVAEREFWFCGIVSVPSLKRDQLARFLVDLAHHRRYQRPEQRRLPQHNYPRP